MLKFLVIRLSCVARIESATSCIFGRRLFSPARRFYQELNQVLNFKEGFVFFTAVEGIPWSCTDQMSAGKFSDSLLKLGAAALAEDCVLVMGRQPTSRTDAGTAGRRRSRKLKGHDSSGHGDDSVADRHE